MLRQAQLASLVPSSHAVSFCRSTLGLTLDLLVAVPLGTSGRAESEYDLLLPTAVLSKPFFPLLPHYHGRTRALCFADTGEGGRGVGCFASSVSLSDSTALVRCPFFCKSSVVGKVGR